MIEPHDFRVLDQAAELLRVGQLVAIPTETVYGLGANAWNADAVRRIFVVKGRPATNPLIVHVASIDRLELAMARPSDIIARRLEQLACFWPGPLTVVVPRNSRIPDVVTAGLDTVGLRIPAHPVALALLQRCEFPVAAPSANRSNYVSPTRAAHVEHELGDRVAMILDGGPCQVGVESTIVSLVADPPRILRVGALSVERIAERLGLSVEDLLRRESEAPGEPTSPQLAPGRLPEHYAPRTPLRFADELANEPWPPRVGWIAFRSDGPRVGPNVHLVTLSADGNLDEIAHGLFDALRQLDQLALDLIVVESCAETGLGRTIMDRLRRARRSG